MWYPSPVPWVVLWATSLLAVALWQRDSVVIEDADAGVVSALVIVSLLTLGV
jgi:hypothetical protein